MEDGIKFSGLLRKAELSKKEELPRVFAESGWTYVDKEKVFFSLDSLDEQRNVVWVAQPNRDWGQSWTQSE